MKKMYWWLIHCVAGVAVFAGTMLILAVTLVMLGARSQEAVDLRGFWLQIYNHYLLALLLGGVVMMGGYFVLYVVARYQAARKQARK